MLRSAHEADVAVTSPSVPNGVAMVIPEHLVEQRSSGPPLELPALLSSSDQGPKPARRQRAAPTSPGSAEAATGDGAVPAAPFTPLPEAIWGVPIVLPRGVVIFGASETGGSAFASPGEAADLSAARNSVVSSGAAPAQDAATSSPPKINPHLPSGPPTSASWATTAADSTSLARAVPTPTVVEAHTASSSINAVPAVPVVAESALSVLGAILPQSTQSSHDVGRPVGQRSASPSSTAPRSTVGVPPASTPPEQTPALLAAVEPTPTLAAAFGAASTVTEPSNSRSPMSKSPAIVDGASIGLASAVPTSVVSAAARAPTSGNTGASGSTVVDIGFPKVFPARVGGEVATSVPMPVADSRKNAAGPIMDDGLSANGPPVVNRIIGPTAAVPILTPIGNGPSAVVSAISVVGNKVPGAAWVSVEANIEVPAVEAARATTGLPPAAPTPAEADVAVPVSVVVAEELPTLSRGYRGAGCAFSAEYRDASAYASPLEVGHRDVAHASALSLGDPGWARALGNGWQNA